MHIPEEDLRGQKFYDSRLMKRILRYANPYRILLIVAFVLLMGASLIEIYLPYISRQAIDRYIVPNNHLVYLPAGSKLRDKFIDRYGGALFVAGKDSFILDGAWLDPADMKQGLAQKNIYPDKYWTIRIEDIPEQLRDSVISLVEKHKDKFISVSEPIGDSVIVPRKAKLPFSKMSLLQQPDYTISYQKLTEIPAEELSILRSNQLAGLLKIAILYFILLTISFIMNFGQIYSLQKVAQNVMHDLRVKLFNHIQNLSLRFFDNTPVGKIVTRATNDINRISEMFTSVLVASFKDLISLFGIGIILFYMSWKLSLAVIGVLPLVVMVTVLFRRAMREAYRWFRKSLASVNAKLSEDLAGMEIIQAFVQQERMLGKFDEVNEEFYRSSIKMLWVNSIFRPLITLFINIAVALVIWYGGGLVIQQTISLGMLVAYLSYINMFFRPIQALANKFSILQSAMAAAERVFGLIDTEPEIQLPDRPYKPAMEQIRGKVEFRNVCFAYKENEWVLKDVSFCAEPGQKIALVGATGAGKTTITALISRMYDIQSGQILVDDVDIREWDITTLRKSIGVVLQDVFLFSTDIRENIRLGEEKIDDSAVQRVAKIVNAYEFIQNLPRQFSEPVAERGATLSAGQRQLLSFARALAFDPKILILDEATANIDTHTEVLIQDAIEKLMKGRTSIVIAHRLSTIRKADIILVMHKGKIIERGSHTQLMRKQGYYSRLYELQFKYMEKDQR